jgi:hypothetical protein
MLRQTGQTGGVTRGRRFRSAIAKALTMAEDSETMAELHRIEGELMIKNGASTIFLTHPWAPAARAVTRAAISSICAACRSACSAISRNS